MSAGFEWLNQLMTWLGRWIPRLLLIAPTHRGVRFGPTGRACEVGPGLVLYWPISHQIVQLPVTTQSVQLCAQLLPLDGAPDGDLLPKVRICAAAIQYRVVDPLKAALGALNLHALVDNRASAAVARHACLSGSPLHWAEQAKAEVHDELAPYGVEIERLDFTQSGIGVALKNISDWTYSDTADGKRPE